MSHYKPYSSYKDSGVDWLGQVPEHWALKRCKYVFREINERSKDGSEDLLSVSEYYGVKPRADVIGDEEHLSRAESLEGYKKCQVDDLVMNIMLAWKKGLGVTAFDGIVSPAYSVFRRFADDSPRFMHSLLRTDTYVSEFKRRSTGVIDSRLRLYPEVFGGVEILLPPLAEQQAIAAFLDRETARIDALIEKKQRQIELLKEKRQAIITQAVTKGLDPDVPMKDSGVEWLGKVPEHWTTPKLSYLTTRIGDGLHSTPEYVDESEFYFINGNNLVDGKIKITEKTRCVSSDELLKHMVELNQSTVLISINGTIGNVALYDGENVILGKSAAYLNCCNTLLRGFLFYHLQSSQMLNFFEFEATGTTIFNLSLKSLRNIPLALPPVNEQDHIVEYLKGSEKRFDLLINKGSASINLLKERRSALITASVTGQIDVRGE